MFKRWYGVFTVGILAILVVLLVVRSVVLQIQLSLAQGQMETFVSTKNSAINGSLAIDAAIDYLQGYYLPGTQLPTQSLLSEMVELVRQDCIQQLVHHKEIGNDPATPPKNE